MHLKAAAIYVFSVSLLAYACGKDAGSDDKTPPILANHSVTPPLIKKLPSFEAVEVYSMISSEDSLPGFRFAGSADGAGFIRAANDGYLMMINNEDNYAVSRLFLDNNLKPTKGEYALNSDGGQWRLCSSTLATQEEHGFGPLYLSAGESQSEAMTHGINPFETALSVNISKV